MAGAKAVSVKSATSRVVDTIIALGPGPLLSSCGYRKFGRSFHVQDSAVFKIVQFQSSMWNTPRSGRFTVNLNIALPYYHEIWTGTPFPKNPGSGALIVQQRIGHLMPIKQDFWWKVTPKSNAARIGSAVASALRNYGLP